MESSLKPSEIHFTHSKINNRFTGCCKLLTETLDEIISGKTLISSIPKIKVFYVEQNGSIKYFSENNRRLWVFKQLEKNGYITHINIRLEKTNKTKYFNNTYVLEAKIIKSEKS